MGVKGLFQFLKRFKKDVHLSQEVSGKSVGIDIFWFIHQSKGDMFSLQGSLIHILNNAKEAHCVFDGTVHTPEKKQELERNADKRNEILRSIKQIEDFLKYPFSMMSSTNKMCVIDHLNDLKRQAWQPSPQYIDEIKSWLVKKKCKLYDAPSEADYVLIDLEKEGIIDTIITNDSDLLVLGSSNIIRPFTPVKGELYNKKSICKNMEFTAQQWDTFMYLCKNMRNKDIVLAFSFVSVYKELEIVLDRYSTVYQTPLLKNLSL
jgi:5'-3' exonuclease